MIVEWNEYVLPDEALEDDVRHFAFGIYHVPDPQGNVLYADGSKYRQGKAPRTVCSGKVIRWQSNWRAGDFIALIQVHHSTEYAEGELITKRRADLLGVAV